MRSGRSRDPFATAFWSRFGVSIESRLLPCFSELRINRLRPRTGLSGSGLYNACIVGRVVLGYWLDLHQRGLRFAPPVRCARVSVVRPRLPRWGGHNATQHTITFPVLGSPVSLIGSELSRTGLWPFALPRPDALSPPPLRSMWRAHNTRRCGHPLRRLLALSGWGYADFHAAVNFAITEFYEVRSQA
jgi:hypothetical protein